MKKEPFILEFNKLIQGFINKSSPSRLKPEYNFYAKILDFFLLGDSYYFIINHQNFTIEFVSKEVEDVLGYSPDDYNMQLLNESIHPDDRSWFLAFGGYLTNFFSHLPVEKLTKYKVRYDMRIRKKNGDFTRILYQGLLLEHDDNGGFLSTMNILTDISYLKQEGIPVLSFIGMDGEPSYYDVAKNNIYIETKEELTSREKQVLKLLIEGKLSKEISSILKISKQTVDTHRKNMLHKKKLSNTGELIGKAIRQGWI
jgi:DNA-binding CsgD family transcriptional regulator